ncbi:cytochrome c oxidase assembly factor 4 homolog, mitochondrial isoform X1 [Loxodonta africana]|nr:cytochrome c oxidase assembly factor 4 homolog, mitochondrial isoform X1 [Loxodonta africana]XP_010597894.1 cytochrome c oxidase assembly factor 4 homolog, mitochondrial isoform X1 [Loxodonta africana]XP_023394733.1 cytochrome c oxidase assembly factor 4 homolog, mitochondrial isoform X1 [Loxodonta africana]
MAEEPSSNYKLQIRLPKMSTRVPQGHTWARQVKEEDEEEDPLDQLISRSGCAASHYAVQECMAQHQDWRQCQPQVQAFKNCMSEQQARRREELQRKKEQASAHR